MRKKFSIIIPILNEKNNIPIIVKKIKASLKEYKFEVIFVDDDSNDGSDKILSFLSKKNLNIKHIIRKNKKKDLSQSCLDGIKKATYDVIIIMDGDLQHDPSDIKNLVNEYYKNINLNLIIAVRDFHKKILGMSLFRVCLSKLLIFLISMFFSKKTKDPMSGFFLIEKKFFMKNRHKYFLQGYKILADILYNSRTEIYCKDVVIKFKKRIHGKSKMNYKILLILIYFLFNNKIKKLINF